MNLLINWGYDINGGGFQYIINELGVKRCYCSVPNVRQGEESGVYYEYIDLDWSLDKLRENEREMLPLDIQLIEKMQPYEMIAMDIIYRWRRSVTTDFSYKNMQNIYYTYLKFWNNYIKKNKIDLVILLNVPHVPSFFIIYSLAKVYDIPIVFQKYLPQTNSKFENKVMSSDVFAVDEWIEKKLSRNMGININKEQVEINNELSFYNYYAPKYMSKKADSNKILIYTEKESKLEIIKVALERVKIYYNIEKAKILLNKVFYYSTLKIKNNILLRYIESNEEKVDLEKNFLYFPLHFQPEASTLPLANMWANQKLIIDVVMSCLPSDVYLYIKEHPAYWNSSVIYNNAVESRTCEFYRYLSGYDNLKLIDHNYKSEELINSCIGVVTATGSVSIEAVVKNKPVLLFSDYIYKYLPHVYSIKDKNQCEKVVNNILNNKLDYTNNEKEIKLFFQAIEEFTVEVGTSQGCVDKVTSGMTIDESSILTAKKMVKYLKTYIIR